MAGKLPGHVKKLAHGNYAFVVDAGRKGARRCEQCNRRHWVEEWDAKTCSKCKGRLGDTRLERRQVWRQGFKTHAAAGKALANAISKLEANEYVLRKDSTLVEYFAAWYPAHVASEGLRASTADAGRRIFARYVADRIGGVRLHDASPTMFNSLFTDLLAGGGRKGRALHPNTVRHVGVLLNCMFAAAVRERLIARNPVADANVPKQRKPLDLNVWSSAEVWAFVDFAAQDRLGAMWRLLALYGPRRGEVLALDWPSIDFDGGNITITKSWGVLNGSPVLGKPKSDRPRVIDVDPETLAALRAHRKAQDAERLASPPFDHRCDSCRNAGADDCEEPLRNPWDDAWVFCHPDGRPLHPNVVTRHFLDMASLVRIEDEQGERTLPRIRLHDLRHSAAALMLKAGVELPIVSQVLGHSSSAFTADIYARFLPSDMKRNAATRIAASRR